MPSIMRHPSGSPEGAKKVPLTAASAASRRAIAVVRSRAFEARRRGAQPDARGGSVKQEDGGPDRPGKGVKIAQGEDDEGRQPFAGQLSGQDFRLGPAGKVADADLVEDIHSLDDGGQAALAHLVRQARGALRLREGPHLYPPDRQRAQRPSLVQHQGYPFAERERSAQRRRLLEGLQVGPDQAGRLPPRHGIARTQPGGRRLPQQRRGGERGDGDRAPEDRGQPVEVLIGQGCARHVGALEGVAEGADREVDRVEPGDGVRGPELGLRRDDTVQVRGLEVRRQRMRGRHVGEGRRLRSDQRESLHGDEPGDEARAAYGFVRTERAVGKGLDDPARH